jgi:hypothetical protein
MAGVIIDPPPPTPGSDWVLAGAVAITLLFYVGLHFWAEHAEEAGHKDESG